MTVLVIAANSLRRLARERSQLFFVFVLPLMLILVLGLTVGTDEPRIGVHLDGDSTTVGHAVVDGLEQVEGLTVRRYERLDVAVDDLDRETITALVVVPRGADTMIDAHERVELEYRIIPGSGGFEQQSLVRSAIADLNATIRAERLVAEQTGLDAAAAAQQVSAVAATIAAVDVVTVDDEGMGYIATDAVVFVAAQELVLFVFLIGMVAASALIRSRQLGVTRRMLATPATASQIVAGEALGRFLVAITQSVFIVVATALLFGVDWGSWAATAAIVASFSLVATAAALFIGALVSNENQSGAIGMSLGLAFAAAGGCMVPFEIFPGWLRTAAHITPHAWAIDAFTEVIQRGGGLAQIGLELTVLTLFGITLLSAATVALRHSIVE